MTTRAWDELRTKGLEEWEFYAGRWDKVLRLQVPDLTVKEQLKISEYLGTEDQPSPDDLEFILSEFQIGEFKRHDRRYPRFLPADF